MLLSRELGARWNALLLDDGCVGEFAHISGGIDGAKGKLAGGLLGDVGVEVQGEHRLVQLAVAEHVEEGWRRLQVTDLWKAQPLDRAHLRAQSFSFDVRHARGWRPEIEQGPASSAHCHVTAVPDGLASLSGS